MIEYKIVRGRSSELEKKINTCLIDGWILYGTPFRTGSRILASGDPCYPHSCSYTSEIAQAIVREENNEVS